jgi:hypothetical protein
MHGMIDSKRKSQSGEHGSLIDVQNSRTSTSRPASPAVPPPASTTQNCRSDQMHPQMQDVLSGPPDDSATIDYLPLNNTTNDRTFIAAMLPLFLSNFNTATSTLVNQPRAPPGLYNDVYIRHLRGLESGPIPTHDPDLAFHGNESSGHDSGATTSHHETIPESPLLSQGTFANPNPFENTLIEYSSGESSPAFSPCQPHKLSPVEEKESQIGSDDSSDDYSAVLPGSAGAIAAADLLHEQSLMILDEESLGIVDVVDGVSATTPPEEEGPSNTAATDSTTPQAYESTRVGEPSDTDWALVVTSDPDTRSTVDAIGQDMDQFLIGGGFRRVESSGAVPDDEPTNEGDDRDDCILSRPQGYSGRGCGVNSTPFYLAKFNTLMKIIRSPDPEDPSKLGIELWEVWDPYPHHKTMNIIGPRFDPSGLDGTIEVQASGHFDCSPDFDPDKRFRRTSMRPLYGLQKLPDWISELKQAFGYPSAESSSQQVPPPYVPSVRKPLGETKISVNEVGSESDVDLKEDDVLEGFPDLESPKTNGKKNKKIWRK